MSHSLVAYDQIGRAFETVRIAVLADPKALLVRSTSSGSSAELHARIGGHEVGAEIALEILGIAERRFDPAHPMTSITFTWKASRNTALFPVMHAVLSLYPLTPTTTRFELSGTYEAPSANAIDAATVHRFAKASLQRLVRDVAARLRRELNRADRDDALMQC